ncbi:uracil-DNA glycosylase family protein [Croceiramulus getboli]|nr:uracil-DNA glycosylase family protein [Flavobacteriaceae bacterium YJPT1-3]
MDELLQQARACTFCKEQLPRGPRPIVEASAQSKIILISQAPGAVVHESGIAWADQSGKRLREWLGVDEHTFYQTDNFSILPMGFCYPGKGATGDLPPRKECAPLWHPEFLKVLEHRQLVLLIGTYAQQYYLPKDGRNLTQRVQHYDEYLPQYWPLPHPSPVNHFWRSKNPWFEKKVVPELQKRIAEILEY